MNNKNKSNNQVNPEIIREQEENRKAAIFYDDDPYGMMLYPRAFYGSTASATESTGLIQQAPLTPGMMGVYDELYSYRRTEPTVTEEDDE